MEDLVYNNMTLDELKQIKRDVDKAIASFEARKVSEARRELEARARELGFSLSQFAEAIGSKRGSVAPKYRNPENPEQTWTGRGRQPVWYREAVEAGRSPTEMAI